MKSKETKEIKNEPQKKEDSVMDFNKLKPGEYSVHVNMNSKSIISLNLLGLYSRNKRISKS